jgi:hypothetical protein
VIQHDFFTSEMRREQMVGASFVQLLIRVSSTALACIVSLEARLGAKFSHQIPTGITAELMSPDASVGSVAAKSRCEIGRCYRIQATETVGMYSFACSG